jgi:hypothetical protein
MKKKAALAEKGKNAGGIDLRPKELYPLHGS